MDNYILDADALINLHRHLRKRMRGLSQAVVQRPEGVYREICRSDDRLRTLVERWKRAQPQWVVGIQSVPNLSEEWQRIDQRYGEQIKIDKQFYSGFWRSRSGHKAADAQVVAVAKVLNGTAVSDDKAIQMACMIENVPCIGWAEFARRIGLVYTDLFGGEEVYDDHL